MGTLGNSIRNLVRSLINNASIRSSITLTPIAQTIGTAGGYGAVTESSGTARTVYGIPSDYISDRVEMLKFGDLKTGEIRLIVRDDEVIDVDDKATFEGKDYHIRQLNPIFFNEVTIASELLLSEKLQ